MASLNIHLRVWRQKTGNVTGHFESYELKNVSTEMSFLEMMDYLNETLIAKGDAPIEFDSDCREGICGSCSLVINGQPHGPDLGNATCQVHMRKFRDNETITIEPFRARAFPVIRDLVVDRSSFDRIIQSGGYVSTKSGPHPDGNAIPIGKDIADKAMDAAGCIGCGACVAACPNASASLFVSAKISQMALLPQGHPERVKRALGMVEQMDEEGFGGCTNIGECEAACPKSISLENISRMKHEFMRATFLEEDHSGKIELGSG